MGDTENGSWTANQLLGHIRREEAAVQRKAIPETITEDERFILTHISRFGSAGYPVKKVGSRHWTWGYRDKNCNVTFPTKREAVASFERHHNYLLDKLAGRAH